MMTIGILQQTYGSNENIDENNKNNSIVILSIISKVFVKLILKRLMPVGQVLIPSLFVSICNNPTDKTSFT